ncbi:hypothetical protein BT67DRAFT_306280 [Trichocladium antarcticum]|uniref:Uncharacterized protein n=1 Tax=Trichocladium antarcticum TaxID=1450529 RepID=A0AAN6UJS0_9PEZI|nr:hypothetical protein BT67DRAFT_306280 [Trichocladium antarcticum]
MASRFVSRPASWASLTRRSSVSSVTRFLLKSNRMSVPPASVEMSAGRVTVVDSFWKRSGWALKASLRTNDLPTSSWCAWSSAQAASVFAGAILARLCSLCAWCVVGQFCLLPSRC